MPFVCVCVDVLRMYCHPGLASWTWLQKVFLYMSSMHLLLAEFDRPDMTLCGWQDVKIQLLTVIWSNSQLYLEVLVMRVPCTVDRMLKSNHLPAWKSFLVGSLFCFCVYLSTLRASMWNDDLHVRFGASYIVLLCNIIECRTIIACTWKDHWNLALYFYFLHRSSLESKVPSICFDCLWIILIDEHVVCGQFIYAAIARSCCCWL